LKKSGFIYGAFILAIVNFITRFIGFSYKIILSRLIGAEGIGLFQIVSPVLMLFITFTTAGIPVAVSNLVAKQSSIGNSSGAKKVFRVAISFTFVLSVFFCTIIVLFSKNIAVNILKNKDVYYSVLFTAPAVLIISLSSVMRGYFYGLKKMNPAGIAQIIEQFSRIIFVIGVLYYLYPVSPLLGSIIAIIGISVGEVFGFAWLLFNYKKISKTSSLRTRNTVKFLPIITKISKISIPITISRLINVAMQLANAVLIPQRLMIAGYSNSEAISIFGRVTGMSIPLIFLPFIVTNALVINLIPNISEGLEIKNYSMIKRNISLSIRITLLVSIPLTLLYVFFSDTIAVFFYNDKAVGSYLGSLAYVTIFISLQHTLFGVLHGMNKQTIATINYTIGASIQLIITYFLVANPAFGINGFILSFILSTFVTCMLNYICLIRIIKINIHIFDYLLKPIFASSISVLLILTLYNYLTNMNIKSYISFFSSIISGVILYLIVLIIIKGIPQSMIKSLNLTKK